MNDFNFCVWDSNGEFLESFRTLKEAFLFCKKYGFNGLIVGRWDRDENGNYTDTYTEIKCYPYYQSRGKGGAKTLHYKNVLLADFLKSYPDNFSVSFFIYHQFIWTHQNNVARTTRGAKTLKNFFVVVNTARHFIEVWDYSDNYARA